MKSDEVATGETIGKERIPEVYKGLDPYSEADADKFFGRTKDIQCIINSLLAQRLTVLYGDSGVGKSSVLRAGVTDALRKEAEQNLEDYEVPKMAVVIFPSLEDNWQEDPLNRLTKQIEEEITEEMGNIFFPIKPPKPELSFVEMLEAWTHVLGGKDFDGWLFIILDQFEEYFQYHPQEKKDGLITEIGKALNQPNLQVNFLISLREDFYVNLNRLKSKITRIFDVSLHIDHLDRYGAEEAIVKPIEHYNHQVGIEKVEIKKELVSALLEHIPQVRISKITKEDTQGGQDKLQFELKDKIFAPYLQLVMTRLWKEKENNSLTLQTLTNLGDKKAENTETKIQSAINNIIYQHLSSVLDDKERFSDQDRDILARSFKYLVTSSQTKYAYCISDLADLVKCDEQKLEDLFKQLCKGKQRIIRRINPAFGQPPRYEIFHDFLASAILEWQQQYTEKIKKRKLWKKIIVGVSIVAVALSYWLCIQKYREHLDTQIRKAEKAEQSFHQGEQLSALQQLVETGRQVKNNILISKPITSQLLSSSSQRETLNKKVTLTFQTILNDIRERNEISLTNVSQSALFFLSPDGQNLAILTTDGTVQFWDWQNQQPLDEELEVSEVSGSVSSLSFSLDSQTLALLTSDGTEKSTVQLWDWQKEQPLDKELEVSGLVSSLSFSPDGQTIAILTTDGTIQLWDWQKGQQSDEFPVSGSVSSLSFSPNSQTLVILTSDGTVQFWDWQNQQPLDEELEVSESVWSLSFSPDGQTLALLTSNGTVQLWDWQNQQPLDEFKVSGLVSSLSFSPDGQTLALLTSDGTVQLWDWQNQQPLDKELTVSGLVSNLSFSPDGQTLAILTTDGTVQLWDWQNQQPLDKELTVSGLVSNLSFSPDNQTLAIISSDDTESTIQLWDWQKGQQSDEFPVSGSVSSLSFSPNSQTLVILTSDGTVQFWDWQKGQQSDEFPVSGSVSNLSFSPDNQTLAIGLSDDTENTVQLWDWQNKQQLDKELEVSGFVSSFSFSPDNQTLAIISSDDTENTIQLWDWQNKQQLDEFPVSGFVSSFSFSPDGQILAIGSTEDTTLASDGKVELWDWQKEQKLDEFLVSGQVLSLSFSPDGNTLITKSTKDNSVFIERRTVYRSLEEMLNQSCKWLKSYLESHPNKKEELGCP